MPPSNCCADVSPPSRSGSLVLNALLALLLLAGLASADTIVATGMKPGQSMVIPIWENGNVIDGNAGVILITLTSNGQSFYRDTVCIDLFTDIYIGQTYDTVVNHPSEFKWKNAPRAAWLVDNAVPPIPLPSPPIDQVDSPVKGAGLQLAIWDIVHDNGDGFDKGHVRAATTTDQNVVDAAIYYEDASVGMSSNISFIYDNYIRGSTTRAQMLIGPGYYQDDGPEPVTPEPPTLVLATGVLLIGIGKFFRPRLRNRGTA